MIWLNWLISLALVGPSVSLVFLNFKNACQIENEISSLVNVSFTAIEYDENNQYLMELAISAKDQNENYKLYAINMIAPESQNVCIGLGECYRAVARAPFHPKADESLAGILYTPIVRLSITWMKPDKQEVYTMIDLTCENDAMAVTPAVIFRNQTYSSTSSANAPPNPSSVHANINATLISSTISENGLRNETVYSKIETQHYSNRTHAATVVLSSNFSDSDEVTLKSSRRHSHTYRKATTTSAPAVTVYVGHSNCSRTSASQSIAEIAQIPTSLEAPSQSSNTTGIFQQPPIVAAIPASTSILQVQGAAVNAQAPLIALTISALFLSFALISGTVI